MHTTIINTINRRPIIIIDIGIRLQVSPNIAAHINTLMIMILFIINLFLILVE